MDADSLPDTSARCKSRRQLRNDTAEGISNPEDVANLLADIVNDEATHPSGAYVVTSPGGSIRVERLPLSVACSRVCGGDEEPEVHRMEKRGA